MTEDYDPHEPFRNEVIDFVSSSAQSLDDIRAFLGRVDTFMNKLVRNRRLSKDESVIVNDYFMCSDQAQRHDFDNEQVLNLAHAALRIGLRVVTGVKQRALVRVYEANALLEECAAISGPLKENTSKLRNMLAERKESKGPAQVIDLSNASCPKRR
jgi:hypothetical protein